MLSQKIIGVLERNSDGIPQFTVKAQHLAALLERDDGVPVWNKMFAAYKKFSPGSFFTTDVKYKRTSTRLFRAPDPDVRLVELDLKGLDFSELTVLDLDFIRCDLQDSDFSN